MGTITRVDLSFDGGNNYVNAHIKGEVLPKCWTRWSFMHTYKKGEVLLLTSRAMDDAGFIQPTVDQEVFGNGVSKENFGKDKTKGMGVESVYHRNAVETWEVTANGEVKHVQIRTV